MNRTLLILFLIIATTWGCSPYKLVRDKTYNDSNLARFNTFGFVESNGELSALSSVNPETVERIKQAIANELTSRGYQSSASPELLVNIGLMVEEKVQTRPTTLRDAPIYTGQRRYSWQSKEIEVGRYNQGTLSVDVVDAQRNQLAWEGGVSSVLTKKSQSQNNIDKAVATLFSKFPGRGK